MFCGRFETWSISSHIRVQITSELVRSIPLIGLNMFSTHNVSDKSLKFFYGLDLEGPSSKKAKIAILAPKVWRRDHRGAVDRAAVCHRG